MKKLQKILTVAAACLTLSGLSAGFSASAAQKSHIYNETDIQSIADGIIKWKKTDVGSRADGFLINDTFLQLAGTTPGDWYPVGLGRLGCRDGFDGYLAVIRDRVEQRYKEPGKLSPVKATEWHRIALAVLAVGGDPTRCGTDGQGQPINLIADGTYDRGKTSSLGRQGINGWIWGLIALDSRRYAVPSGSFYSRDDIIREILCRQLPGGGFALSGTAADPDITAMAVQALSPYYNSEKSYRFTPGTGGNTVTKTARESIDSALACLSGLQLATGDYKSWGTQNVESTAQVVVALCSLGIDPQTDGRFIKNGKTLLDGILAYRMKDGGFIHSRAYDPDNPTSLPNKSNSMAGEQVLYTMAAVLRQRKGLRTLYDFRPEQGKELRTHIQKLSDAIAALSAQPPKTKLTELLKDYYAVEESERSYVYDYSRLSALSRKAGIDMTAVEKNTPVLYRNDAASAGTAAVGFDDADRREVDGLPEKPSTKNYAEVVRLLDKLEQSGEFSGREEYRQKLLKAKSAIAGVQAEIDAINREIREKLYPFQNMSIGDKPLIDSLVRRYRVLDDYDKSRIERWEDVVKTKTKVDNQLRAVVIAVVLAAAIVGLSIWEIKRIKKRRRKKQAQMEELAAMYGDEDRD